MTVALRERDERWRLAISRVGDPVLVANADGMTTELNEAAEEVLGLSSSEAKGTPLESLLARIGQSDRSGGWDEAIWKNPRRSILDESGRTVGVVAVVAGGWIRGEAEAAIRESAAAAERAIAAKDRFLAVLSHELRTPLTPVLMAVSAALDDPSVPADLHSMLDMIRRNIEFEAKLIDDLLDASMMDRGPFPMQLAVVDVHETLRETLALCNEKATFVGLQIRLELSAGRHHVRADQGRLGQVFRSLIHNAAKYSRGPEGTLRISSVGSEAATGRLILEFCDDGIGFDADRLTLLFRPFEQGRDAGGRRGGGLGLGLSIGRHIVESLGGRLDARSEGPGRGATFRVELSTVDAPAPAARTPPARLHVMPVSAAIETLRILLVEDNNDTLRYITAVLKMKGHAVEPVDRVEAAREALARSDFDLLISDIELPDGTGLELMADARGTGLKGIAMSGFGSVDDLQMSDHAGFSMHLTKPIDVRSLEDAIRQVSGTPFAM